MAKNETWYAYIETTTSEAKAPVGLMKLAATVAANNKKRKNALQIQKYIGEDAKTGRMSDDDLAAAHKKIQWHGSKYAI